MVDYQVGMGTGTLWINLKNVVLEDHQEEKKDVMKFRDKDHEDEDIDVEIQKNNDDNKRRICHVCKKGFSSGKALGGHMKIHVQASKKQLFLGEKSKSSKSREEVHLENCKNDQLLPTCSMCGKNFPSMKSLFGHMRCHPERAWRGIQPPPHLKSSDEICIKRAEKTASTVGTVSVPEEAQLQDAVHHLMLLANGHDTPEDQLEKTNSNSLTSKAENDEFHASESKIINNGKRKKKKMKLRDLNSISPASTTWVTPEKYKCNTCGKSFETHQALGGHKSSHNKYDSTIEEAEASSSKLLADSKLSSSQLNSPGEFSHTTTGQRILDFDLNEFPPDHQEDEIPGNNEYFPFFPI